MTERDDRLGPCPVAPPKPEPGACCGNGCDPCVYDEYWDALDQYKTALAEWERKLAEKTSITAIPPEG